MGVCSFNDWLCIGDSARLIGGVRGVCVCDGGMRGVCVCDG